MQVFTIRDIENLTGIKAHTLRIWEQRYQLLIPARKEGNHRLYSNEDLKHLLKISILYHHGLKISRIAALSRNEVDSHVLNTFAVSDPYQLYVTSLLDASVDLDEYRLEKVLDTCINQYGFERTMFHVAYPFLNKVGLLWDTGHVVPAMEHFASNIIMRKIAMASQGVEAARRYQDARVLLFTPEMERHEIPIRMMQYLLKKNGIATVFMGQHVPDDVIAAYCRSKQVTHLYTHIITYLHRLDIEEYIAELSSRFRDQQIVVSGSIVQPLQRNFVNVRVLRTPEEMIAFSREL